MTPRSFWRASVPWLALLGAALVAGAPLLSATAVPNGYDTAFHFWRAVEAEALLRAGVLFPRLAPAMAWGYGYPLFIFQGALSAQLAAGLHLTGLPWTVALNAAFFIGLAGSALALYGLARALWGRIGGWCAAALFLYIPYHLYVAYFRGSLSELLAWCFPPVILWGLTCWMAGQRRGLWAGVLACAALAMTHPVSLYLFAPLFGLWALAEALGAEKGARWPAFGRGALLLALGAGASAFAWGPGLFEQSSVQLGRSTSAWVFEYARNFLPLDQLLALPRNADPVLLNDWPARGLGGLFVLAALCGLLTWRGQDRRGQLRLGALALALVVCVFLSLEVSQPLWDTLPFLPSFQFPWRFLAPASLALVLLAGAGIARLATLRRRGWALLATGALIVSHWGWLYPPPGTLPADASTAGMLAWERATDTVGTTASRELLPRWVEHPPDWDNPLTLGLLAGTPATRLAELPEGAVVSNEVYRNGATRLEITTPRAFAAHYLAFYYPGWRARIDGAPVATTPADDTGLVSFAVPAGAHVVEVDFTETPLRWGLDGVSLLSLTLLAVLLLVWPKKSLPLPASPVKTGALYPLLALAGALLLLKVAVSDVVPVPWRRARLRADGSLATVAVPLDVNFDGRAVLLGVDALPAAFSVDDAPLLRFYWRALAPEGRDWRMGLSLIGPDGSAQALALQVWRWGREAPALSAWPAGRYAQMAYTVQVEPGAPPGDYTLALSLFDRQLLSPASPLGADGNPLGPVYRLGEVRLERPRQASVALPPGAVMRPCGDLGLWTAALDRAQAAPGEQLVVRWLWEALAAPSTPLSATLALRDPSGALVRSWDFPPATAWWSTDQWLAGERWAGQPSVRLPGSLAGGDYCVEVYGPGCSGALASLPLRVVTPERLWEVPPDFTPSADDFGQKIRLAGYAPGASSLAPGETLSLRLAWQALAEMDTSYRVFVHLVGPDGRVLAQSDGEPDGWTRPTPGWAAGEVVLDDRAIAIPLDAQSGVYELRIGWYVLNGDRLQLSDGRDAVVLAAVTVTSPP